MTALAYIYLAGLLMTIASCGSHYLVKPSYDRTHPVTWVATVAGACGIALALLTVFA